MGDSGKAPEDLASGAFGRAESEGLAIDTSARVPSQPKSARACSAEASEEFAAKGQLEPPSAARTAYMLLRVSLLSIFAVICVVIYAVLHFALRGLLLGVAAGTVLASALLAQLMRLILPTRSR